MKNSFFKQLKRRNRTEVKSHIPFRLNFLFFIVFVLFLSLVIRLAYLQIIHLDFFEDKVKWGQKNIVENNAPRGMIYDASGQVLVGNRSKPAVIYTKKAGMTAQEILDVSRQLTQILAIKAEDLSERDLKDYWLADENNLAEARKRLTDKEKVNDKGALISAADEYQLLTEKVTPEEIQFDEEELKVASVFKRINGAYALTPVIIKNEDVTPEEIAQIGESVAEIPGISTGMDWDREYPQGDALRSILGTVSSEKTGLPQEEVEEYLKKGYARNDRVGLSYLEKQYEPVLRGTKSKSEITINQQNEIENQEEVTEGKKGQNVKLTIDIDFQKQVTDIVRRNYQQLINNGKARYSDGAYAVALNPQTGEVLAMVGLNHDTQTQELTDDTLGTINKAFVPGSVIKGATVMAGFEQNILPQNDVMIDEPLRFGEGAGDVKSSLFNQYGRVPLNTVQALTVSSNVYMMKLTLKMMGVDYYPGMNLPERPDVYDTLRGTFKEYGLGDKTGIDLPGESTGLAPTDFYDEDGNLKPGKMGNLLDLSFGNYDTYTPMQLAQYVATIANDGVRVAPRVVEGVYDNNESGGLGEPVEVKETKVMNEVKAKEHISVVQEGFYNVVNGTDYRRTGRALQGGKYVISAKTGTAETPIPNPNNPNEMINLVNSSMVAYAPQENPELAVSVIIPHIQDESDALHAVMTKEIFNAYYDYKH